MVVLDATIVNIALPHAQHDLYISDGNRQWVITAYALAFGGLLLFGAVGLILGGFLTQSLNWRWTFFVNVPFAAIAVLGAWLVIREPASPASSPTAGGTR